MARADAAGVILADILASGSYGKRPLRLIGFSLGARMIFRALLELHRRGSKQSLGLVEEVVLMGLPETNKRSKWRAARSIVSGRFVNGFSTRDWVLKFLFRASDALGHGGIAGVDGATPCPGVENVDLSRIVRGHLEYRTKMRAALSCVYQSHCSDYGMSENCTSKSE